MPPESFSVGDAPLAYLVTFSLYGTWLHGDPRGSTARAKGEFRARYVPERPSWRAWERRRLKGPPVVFDKRRREVALQAMLAVCRLRGWEVLGMNMLENHFHGMFKGDVNPMRVVAALKAYATHALVESGLIPRGMRVWTRGASRIPFWTPEAVRRAAEYVVEGQGPIVGVSLARLE